MSQQMTKCLRIYWDLIPHTERKHKSKDTEMASPNWVGCALHMTFLCHRCIGPFAIFVVACRHRRAAISISNTNSITQTQCSQLSHTKDTKDERSLPVWSTVIFSLHLLGRAPVAVFSNGESSFHFLLMENSTRIELPDVLIQLARFIFL